MEENENEELVSFWRQVFVEALRRNHDVETAKRQADSGVVGLRALYKTMK